MRGRQRHKETQIAADDFPTSRSIGEVCPPFAKSFKIPAILARKATEMLHLQQNPPEYSKPSFNQGPA